MEDFLALSLTCHYPDLVSASDWLKECWYVVRYEWESSANFDSNLECSMTKHDIFDNSLVHVCFGTWTPLDENEGKRNFFPGLPRPNRT